MKISYACCVFPAGTLGNITGRRWNGTANTVKPNYSKWVGQGRQCAPKAYAAKSIATKHANVYEGILLFLGEP
jgi:hypothetical protein